MEKESYQRKKKWIQGHESIINLTLGILAVLMLSIGFARTLPDSPLASKNLKEYTILQKMVEVDNIAHKRDELLCEFKDGYNMDRDTEFHRIDQIYHNAQYRDEKFKAAEALNILFKQQKKYLETIQKIDTGMANEFNRLQEEIETLKLP